MDKVINVIDSVAVLRKEVKAYINAAVKSKFFTTENNSIEIKALLEQVEEKKKGDFLSIAATNDNTCMEFCVEIPKKVSKKVNAEMFEKMTAIYAKRKTPINIKVNFATDNC